MLGEFGPAARQHHPDTTAHGGPPGPLHNQIPQPNRAVDNTTIWTADFNQAHYDKLLYNKGANPSMANYYLEQSSGKYSVDGYVSDWNPVPNNANSYGSNYCGSNVCQGHLAFRRMIGRHVVERARCPAGQRRRGQRVPGDVRHLGSL